MKKNIKLFVLIGSLLVLIFILVFMLLYFFNNRDKNYTFKEKNWMNSNSNIVIDVSMEGALPLFSNNGEGIFYDYINELEKNTKLTFNIVVNGNADYRFINKNNVASDDLLFYTDNYVIISPNDIKINDINSLKDQPIGIIKSDKDYISNFLSEYNFQYSEYSNISDLKNDMNNSIVYAIVPMTKYINEIIYNKYNIVYHIEGLYSYYVLNSSQSNSILSSIFTKFYNKWKENIDTNVGKYLLNLYYQSNGLTELEKETITANDLIVGYIDNLPYEGKVNNEFSGITNEYLKRFSDMTNATYKYISYKNIDELINALNNKKVDLVMNYYNITNNNYSKFDLEGNIEYVVLTNINNELSYDSLNTLKNTQVKMLNNTALNSYIANQNISINGYNSFKDLFNKLEEDDILIVEKSVYEYFKNRSLKQYVIKSIGNTNNNNSYLVSVDNKVLNGLFKFYLTTIGNKRINNLAISNSSKALARNMIIEFIISNILYILILLFALFFFIFKLNKRIKITKKIRKEDKMLYLDVMTNLKNRNYLNDNLVYWEANKVYPQTIVIVDLNDIAVINDTKGHEEGDKQIQAAARILINTQRENSEIVRTNGNEFLIYLVGYDEKQVVTYVNKLMKEFKNLPYEFGASVGYHMITTESVTIDDAINEAIIMMRKNKGE